MSEKTRYLLEVTGCSIGLIALLWWFAKPWMISSVGTLPREQQAVMISFCSLVAAGAIAGSFNLTYEKTAMRRTIERWIAHGSKFSLYLAIGLLLEVALTAIGVTPGFFNDPPSTAAILLFLTLLTYNYWDLLRYFATSERAADGG